MDVEKNSNDTHFESGFCLLFLFSSLKYKILIHFIKYCNSKLTKWLLSCDLPHLFYEILFTVFLNFF